MTLCRPLILFLALILAGCQNNADQNHAIRDSLALLNSLEDRTFAVVQLDGRDGSIPLVGTLQELNALAQEARQAVMPGCVGQARDALVSAMEEIAQSGKAAWSKVEHYVNTAMACESLLAEQERLRAAPPG